jgi:hypothetical protein
MVATQVQRTLVKSPPELWAELSDPAALARHLGELGAIRITRIEPEHKVEWTAERASGTVLIDPSGWGTRVTITASGELSEPNLRRPEPQPRPPQPQSEGPERQPSDAVARAQAPHAPHAGAPRLASIAAADLRAPTPPKAAPPIADSAQLTGPPEPQPIAAAPEPAPGAHTSSAFEQAGPEPIAPPPPSESNPVASQAAQEPARGFLSRLLRRMRGEPQVTPQTGPAQAPVPAAEQPAQAATEPTPAAAEPAPGAPQSTLAAPDPQTPAARLCPPGPSADRGSPAAQTDRAGEGPARTSAEQAPAAPSTGPLQAAAAEQAAPAQAQGQQPLPAETPDLPPAGNAGASESLKPGSARQGERPGDDVEAVLTSVLDRLGSAHHRPFSRG